jgi:hypothetical protein
VRAAGVRSGAARQKVIARRIVFVDLALAQLSALGAVIGSTMGWDPIASSVIVTLAGAALLVLPAETDLPQEALMGLVYAVASAAAVLILAKSPHGDADLLHILFGNILAVTPRQLWLLAGLAAAVAAFSRYRRTRAAVGRGATLVFYLLLAVSIASAMKSGRAGRVHVPRGPGARDPTAGPVAGRRGRRRVQRRRVRRGRPYRLLRVGPPVRLGDRRGVRCVAGVGFSRRGDIPGAGPNGEGRSDGA